MMLEKNEVAGNEVPFRFIYLQHWIYLGARIIFIVSNSLPIHIQFLQVNLFMGDQEKL